MSSPLAPYVVVLVKGKLTGRVLEVCDGEDRHRPFIRQRTPYGIVHTYRFHRGEVEIVKKIC